MTPPVTLPRVGGARLFPHWSILKRPYPVREERLFEPLRWWQLRDFMASRYTL